MGGAHETTPQGFANNALCKNLRRRREKEESNFGLVRVCFVWNVGLGGAGRFVYIHWRFVPQQGAAFALVVFEMGLLGFQLANKLGVVGLIAGAFD
jgi:hypothetical protein